MAFIIPDKILETLLCDSCHKYLSVKPIKVFPNRRIKCGRCCRSKKQSDGVVSLYGVIAEKCVFKCINRFDGCRELLTYSQVRDHERICLEKVYKCPICPESTEIATFLLIRHFRDNHKDARLDYPGFVFNLNAPSETSRVYLYQQEDNLFFLNFSSSELEETIRLSISYVGDFKVAKNINQQFTVSHENKELDFTSKAKPCSAYSVGHCDYFSINISHSTNIFIKFQITLDPKLIKLPIGIELNGTNNLIGPTIPIEHVINYNKSNLTPMVEEVTPRTIFLNSTFLQKFPKYPLSKCGTGIISLESQIEFYLHCYNCQEICWRGLSHDILVQRFYYSTTFKHSICYYCFQMLKYEKKVKENDYMVLNFPKDMLKNIEFFCKWNCGETFNAQYHLGHEQSCNLQPLHCCPACNCNFRGTILEIAVHMATHPGQEICTYSNFYISSLFDRNIYVFLNNKFIYLRIVSNQGFSIKVHMAVSDDYKEEEKWTPVVLLFDDSKNFQMTFQNSITKNEGNHWVKIILTNDRT